MSIYIFKIFCRLIGTLLVSLISLSANNNYQTIAVIENTNYTKTKKVVSTVVEYDTVLKYNSKLPANKKNVIVEGKNGLNYQDKDGSVKELNASVSEVIEVGTGPSGNYTGNTTGYGGDCKGCSGTVSCKTREGSRYNLVSDGEYYHDNQYGDVRVVAADLGLFKCGTIIEIDNGTLEPFLGIVMDTGSSVSSNLSKYGLVHIDIAHTTEKDPVVYQATSKNAEFSVQRWGW